LALKLLDGLTIKDILTFMMRVDLIIRNNMSPWDMVAALGIYTDEQIDEMTWAECVEILNQEE
jgi:fructose-1,6-bisphosphatase/inositol monophosphatase family enzyme